MANFFAKVLDLRNLIIENYCSTGATTKIDPLKNEIKEAYHLIHQMEKSEALREATFMLTRPANNGLILDSVLLRNTCELLEYLDPKK